MREFSVLEMLPDDGEVCVCFGHKTFCCKDDMDEMPAWHDVTFRFELSSYKLKEKIPQDPEDSILEFCNFVESWEIGPEFHDGHVIGVTKWKKLAVKDAE